MEKYPINFDGPLGSEQNITKINQNFIAPISRMISGFVKVYDQTEYDLAFREMIKVFVSVFKYSGLLIISDYLRIIKGKENTDLNNSVKEIDKFIYTNISGMSLGHWQWCLREITRWAKNTNEKLFVSEIISLYWKSNGKPTNTAQWIDNKMIPLRNDFVHSDIWMDKESSKKLIHEHLPLLLTYLDQISFINKYQLKSDDNKSFYVSGPDQSRLDLNYLIICSKKEEWGHEELLFFETLKGKSVKYLLGNLYNFENEFKEQIKKLQSEIKQRMELYGNTDNQDSKPVSSKYGALSELLNSAASQLTTASKELCTISGVHQSIMAVHNSVDSASDRITTAISMIESLQNEYNNVENDEWTRCLISAKLMIYREMVYSSGDFSGSGDFDALYLERTDAKYLYNNFVDNKDSSLCLMLAESGAGKTQFCFRIVRDFIKSADQDNQKKEDIVFYFPGSKIPSVDLDRYFNSTLGGTASNIINTIHSLAQSAEKKKSRLIIIIDGLNENEKPHDLIEFIAKLCKECQYPWFKVFATCRIVMWETLSRGIELPKNRIFSPVNGPVDLKGEIPFVRLNVFNSTDVKSAYHKYAANRFIRTPYDNLPSIVKELCCDPFLLNIITDAYRGSPQIRNEIKSGSLASIFERYLFSTSPKKLTRPSSLVKSPSDYTVVIRMLELMWKNKRDFLTEEELQSDSFLNEKIYEPPLAFSRGDYIQCNDSICHWHWRPEPTSDFPFNCPECRNNTLLWENEQDTDILKCKNENCTWQWIADKSRSVLFNCPNGHKLDWGVADQRTPYQRLCDEGILSEVNREGDTFILKFRYDRIFEYLMATEHLMSDSCNITRDDILTWCSEISSQEAVSPIFLEAVSTALSFSSECVEICDSILFPYFTDNCNLIQIISGSLKKLAVTDALGQQQILPLLKKIIKTKDERTVNQIVIPVIQSLRRRSTGILELLLLNPDLRMRKKFSEILYQIFSSNIDDGLWILNTFLSKISISRLFRYRKVLSMYLEISLKLASMMPRDKTIDLLNMWVTLLQRLLGYGEKNPIHNLIRNLVKQIILIFGSGIVLGQFKKMKIGTTTLYNVLFRDSPYKKGMKSISDFLTPMPQKLNEISGVIGEFLDVPVDDGNSEGKEMLGLLPIICLNVQLRKDPVAALPVLKSLFDNGKIYARWALCSAVNYSLQESYFANDGTKPFEKDRLIVSAYRDFLIRLLNEERDGIVRDSLITGDYYFPLGILVEFSFAAEDNCELIRTVFDYAVQNEDYLLLRKLLLDMMCFSLDTFCVQRRFWEKTLDLLPEFINRLFPLTSQLPPFHDKRDSIEGLLIEAIAVFQYVHPEETSVMISKLVNQYRICSDSRTINWLNSLGNKSQLAMHKPFAFARTNAIGLDKNGKIININSIVEFIDRFLYGWIFADFVSVIFGRYPEFRNTAKDWIQETINPVYEKNPKDFSRKLFRAVFDGIEKYEPGSASFL